ncbi:Rgp1-domain-containing protein [Pisolithus croceorrhizus]|nr:Rgp1-domain-containing protein [Pisolithus croceorrhizus]KAI6105156.1 Rgp1-domain-containing protein [Pisolithus croceorrhizus]
MPAQDESTTTITTDTLDSAIRVHVSPSQASYFAGEPFTVTITFTNMRTPESSPKGRNNGGNNTHKRGAHSISSAPLARPPTSPGIPRPSAGVPLATTTNITSTPSNSRDLPTRKRLIGQQDSCNSGTHTKAGGQDVLEQKRRSLIEKSRSLSVDIPAPGPDLSVGEKPGSQYVRAYNEFSDATAGERTTPTAASPLPRTSDFQLPPHHPHARKQSLADGQTQFSEVPAPPPPPGLASSSTSTFSLALDPIAESPVTPYPGTPSPKSPPINEPIRQSPVPKREPQPHLRPPPTPASGRSSQLGLGHGAPPPRGAIFPDYNTELILYSYAQLLGTLSVTPLPGIVMSPEHAKALTALRMRLLKRPIVGGGSMDITSRHRVQERSKFRQGRALSLASGLFSLLSPSGSSSAPTSPLQQPSSPWKSGRPRTTSIASTSPSPTSSGHTTNGLNDVEEENVDLEMPLPTFEVQPAMLAVDLSLAPGESRTYTYSLMLPANLPPTFRGRSLKFSYELIVGTCRASASAMRSSSSLGPTGANSVSRVMKVPIRVYNHVAVSATPKPYDLLWPVTRQRTTAEFAPKVVDGPLKNASGSNKGPAPPSLKISSRSLDETREYGRRLLGTLALGSTSGATPKSVDAGDLEREIESENGSLTGCREAVEILTRNPRKVSYDVNKDGVKVAVLTFPKSAYRLGETVLGVVELNEVQSRARVLSLSALLEAQERLPGPISTAGNVRHMRRVHAEHHSSFVAATMRTTFSLDIPSDASPAFQIQIGEEQQGVGGLSWRVKLCLLVGVASESSDIGSNGSRFKHLVRDGRAGEWGVPYRASETIAPMERTKGEIETGPATWTQYLVSSLLGGGERRYHDGDEEEVEEEETGEGDEEGRWPEPKEEEKERGWKEVKVETVECEVPIRVWPGNTAFNAMEVVFDV